MSKLKGLDVSHWQGDKGFEPSVMEGDFMICKATEGNNFKDGQFVRMAESTLKSGKLLGLYHFAKGKVSAVEEANWFVKNIKNYIGKAVLFLDWEADALKKGPAYALEWVQRVKELTGVTCPIYMSTNVTTANNWSSFIAAGYPYLWGAEYNGNPIHYGYQDNPTKKPRSLGGFTEIIRQYSSNTFLPGFAGKLDANEAYITKEQWNFLVSGKMTDGSGSGAVTPPPEPVKKLTVDEVARKIIAQEGEWDVNGIERTKKLREAGYDPKEVQARINEIVKGQAYVTPEANVHTETPVVQTKITPEQAADNIINGVDGWKLNGDARVKKLEKEGLDPKEVQTIINNKLKVKVTTCKFYTVKRGDTMSGIARSYKMTLAQLKILNPNIKNVNLINVGDKIRVQ